MPLDRTLVVKPTSVRILGWIVVVFMLFCAIMAWRADRGRASASTHAFVVLLFLTFVAMGIYLLLTAGSVEVTGETISYRSPVALYQINLSEVTYIEIDRSGHSIVFCGENKRLAALGPMYWSGSDKKRILNWLGGETDKRGIEIRPTEKAMYRFSKNTRVRNSRPLRID